MSFERQLLPLEGKSAVVTGAGQGIGAAIAKGLATRGAHVVVIGRHADTLEVTCGEITATGGSAEICVADVTEPSQLEQAMRIGAGVRGVLDILVNNAGIAGPTTPLAKMSLEEWTETISVNLTGVFLACRAALPFLERADRGKILNIGSVTGKQPLPNRAAYAAAKLGVVGLTRTLAHEVGPLGISVNLISPWLVEGDRLEDVLSSMSVQRGVTPDELRKEMTEGTAFKRTVREKDVVDSAMFLCSEAADNLTGLDFNVSAGAVMY